jgi:hypothetical protein
MLFSSAPEEAFHQHVAIRFFTSDMRFASSPRLRAAIPWPRHCFPQTSKAMHDPASELSHSVCEHILTGAGPGVGWVVAHAGTRETQIFSTAGRQVHKSMVPNVIPSESSVQGSCPPSALRGYSARDRGSGDAVILDGQGPVPRSFRQRRPLGLSSLNLQLPSTYILRQTVRLEDSVDPVAARHRRKTNLNLGCLKGNVTDSGSVIIYLSDSHIHDQRPTDVA